MRFWKDSEHTFVPHAQRLHRGIAEDGGDEGDFRLALLNHRSTTGTVSFHYLQRQTRMFIPQSLESGSRVAVLLDFDNSEGGNAAASWVLIPPGQPADGLGLDLAEPDGDSDANDQQHDRPNAVETSEPEEAEPYEERDQGPDDAPDAMDLN